VLDVISLSAHGVDTVRASFRVLDSVPETDPGWRSEMLGAGFEHSSRTFLEDGEVINSDTYQYQDERYSTLRLTMRGGSYLAAEFSAPRLLDDSPINTRLASPGEVDELLEFVGGYASALIPGEPALERHKLSRLDYAADLEAGPMLPGVISAGAQFRIPGARKLSSHVYPGETSTVRSSWATFRAYSKGLELREKLRPADREKYAEVIRLTREKGVTRMEFSDRRRGGLAWSALPAGSVGFSERLQQGFGGGVVVVGGLAHLEAEITALGLDSRRAASLLTFATRYAVLGEHGMKERYSKTAFHRTKRLFLEYGLRLDDVCSFEGEIDLRPVIQELKAA
jgi:hypothetical protein